MPKTDHIGLTSRQVQNFIDDGFVRIENAFSTSLAKQCRDELWADIGLSPDRPENWIQPVVRVASKAAEQQAGVGSAEAAVEVHGHFHRRGA